VGAVDGAVGCSAGGSSAAAAVVFADEIAAWTPGVTIGTGFRTFNPASWAAMLRRSRTSAAFAFACAPETTGAPVGTCRRSMVLGLVGFCIIPNDSYGGFWIPTPPRRSAPSVRRDGFIRMSFGPSSASTTGASGWAAGGAAGPVTNNPTKIACSMVQT